MNLPAYPTATSNNSPGTRAIARWPNDSVLCVAKTAVAIQTSRMDFFSGKLVHHLMVGIRLRRTSNAASRASAAEKISGERVRRVADVWLSGMILLDSVRFFWSAGRELNPRVQVLQTCALAASPPALMKCLVHFRGVFPENYRSVICPKTENPPASSISGGGSVGIGRSASSLAQPFPHARMHAHATHLVAATDTGGH